MAGRLCLAFAAALLQGVTNATPIPEGPAWTKGAVFNVYGWSDLQYGLPLFFDTDSGKIPSSAILSLYWCVRKLTSVQIEQTGSIVMTDYEIASQTDTYLPLACKDLRNGP
jgi:hypothetical protein